MEKGGLYNRGSIMLSKSKRQVNKNMTYAVDITCLTMFRIKNSKNKTIPSRRSKRKCR